jgi:ferredoxin-NADP reductase
VSVREPNSLIYADELVGDDVTVLFTRSGRPGSVRVPGRISLDDLGPHARPDATVYICGSAGFAAAASDLAVESGFHTRAIRVERFGPTV